MKRSTKFYRKNEAEVMRSLGMKETKNSGSGWVEKEDGQNDYLICQLKSTDAQSIKVNQSDIRILEKNATVAHKIPIFAIQFLNTGEVWLMSKPEDLPLVSEYITTGTVIHFDLGIELGEEVERDVPVNIVQTPRGCGRTQFYEEQARRFDKTKSAK